MARSMPVCRGRRCRRLTSATSFYRPCRRPAAIAGRRLRSSASRWCLFACAVPFAGVPLAPVPAFVASYQSALAINDVITAILLFSQFAVSRSRALLLLASGYLFTAAAAIVARPHLSRPVCAQRIAGCGSADHRLALHGLARRLSAARARLCAAESQR